MRSGGVALDGDCREGGTYAFSAIRLKLAFSGISNSTFNFQSLPFERERERERERWKRTSSNNNSKCY